MDNVTIISYPGARDDSLLSLTQDRSRYMLPFGGKFRVIDFTLRNSFSAGARNTIIYSTIDDGLEDYVERYGPFKDMKFPPIKIVTREYSDINTCYHLILDSNTRYYIIYNGDNPSIIDFHNILTKYRAARAKSMLFLLSLGERATMAYKVLVIDQKTLLKVVNQAVDEKRSSPNIFEMIINIMINSGIKKSTLKAHYWPIKNIPEYFNLHHEVIWNPEIFNLLFHEKIIQSKINAEGYASIGPGGKVARSFMSDYCYINGTVENSIIYPGVKIEEGAVVKDSIILPFVKIGSGARIYRSIIDERTDNRPENIFFNVENLCKVGTEDGPIKNSDFPHSLFNGITLIGKNCRIHNEAKIGGGCFVASGLGEEYFARKKYLYDGTSLVK